MLKYSSTHETTVYSLSDKDVRLSFCSVSSQHLTSICNMARL